MLSVVTSDVPPLSGFLKMTWFLENLWLTEFLHDFLWTPLIFNKVFLQFSFIISKTTTSGLSPLVDPASPCPEAWPLHPIPVITAQEPRTTTRFNWFSFRFWIDLYDFTGDITKLSSHHILCGFPVMIWYPVARSAFLTLYSIGTATYRSLCMGTFRAHI